MPQRSARSAVVLGRRGETEVLPRQFLPDGGESTLIEYVLDSVWTVVDEIYVVFSKEPSLKTFESISPFGVRVMIGSGDLLEDMMVGMKAIGSELCLVVSDETPFLKPSVIFALFEAARDSDAAVAKWQNGRILPLPGVYRRSSFLRIGSGHGKHKDVRDIIDDLYAVRFLSEEELRQIDPELHSFFQVLWESDLIKAKQLVGLAMVR